MGAALRSATPRPDRHTEGQRLVRLIEEFAGRSVAVIGDIFADEFIYGQIARVSREAPVLILDYDATEIVPGGAGNAANNVAALGGRARAVGLVGRDEAGRRLLAAFHPRVDTSGLLHPARYRTPTKTRILAGGVHSAKQQVVRIDRKANHQPDAKLLGAVARAAVRAVRGAEAVLFSDYGSGLVTPRLVGRLRRVLRAGRRRRPVPMLVDSRYALLQYRGLTACTPNEAEVEHLLGVRIDENLRVLERAGRALLGRTRMRAVLITRGSRGMALFEPRRPTVHIPIFGTDQVADVTGAGDTVIATVTLALAAGASFYEAARLANYAAGLVVMKRGTATVSAEELREAVQRDTAQDQLAF